MFVWIGVGIGEVGLSLFSYLIIVDFYFFEKCVSVMGVYLFGVVFGVGFGMLIGGVVVYSFGWWVVMFMVGIFGIIFVFVVCFVVVEL